MDRAVEKRNSKLGNLVVKALKNRQFEAFYVENRQQAVEKALELIKEGDSVSWGGSATLNEIGLIDKLYENKANYTILDRAKAAPGEDIQRMAFSCDTYLASANAISEDGQLVNVDGNGNRVAAMIFGPKSVIIIAGMNKIVKSLDDAIVRARTIAAPTNCQRFDRKTPCNVTGSCGDCKGEQSICANVVISRVSNIKGRIKVILVGESLGF